MAVSRMTIKRVGRLWYVMEGDKILKVFTRFKDSAQWVREQTRLIPNN